MSEALEVIARLPRLLALELLDAPGTSVAGLALALELSQHEDDATFGRFVQRLERADDRPEPRIEALFPGLFSRSVGRARHLAAAELSRTGSPRAAMWLYRCEATLGDEAAARRALDQAEAGASKLGPTTLDPSEGRALLARIALERLRDPHRPISPLVRSTSARSASPRDRFLVHVATLVQARGAGRYARVAALDALLELATEAHTPGIAEACLRAALEHADALGDALTELELDRIRTLHRQVAPELSLGAPIESDVPPPKPTELELRAREALRGAVRGELPPSHHPDHAAALALTALAHLVARRDHAALPLIAQLARCAVLPQATWGVVFEASRPGVRRATAGLAVRAALELPPPSFALVALARRVEAEAQRALLCAALRREPDAARALREDVEREAMALRDAGRRPLAIALLTQLEAALRGDDDARAALARRTEARR